MSYWNGNEIIRFEPEPVTDNPEWEIIDCGCCNGWEWGRDYPVECERCGGNGILYHHKRSGLLTLYIGGPIVGRMK